MFSTQWCSIALVTAAMFTVTHSRAEDPSGGRKDLTSVQETTRELAREVEFLQDLLVELSNKEERTLYLQADNVLSAIEDFQKSLKPETSRKRVQEAFEPLDGKVHKLLKALQDAGPEHRVLQRSAARVGAADDQLHFELFAPGGAEGKADGIVERQVQALVMAARRLDKTAEYTLGTTPGKGVLVGDLHKLAQAVEEFQKNLASETDRSQLRKKFAALNQAWEKAVRGMRDLRASQHIHLIRAAGQFDRLHERLHRLLGLEGERSRLILNT
jgi:exonuclease VII large subunit